MTLKLNKKDNPIALRKQLIQMRLELNRQKIRHESITLLEPLQKFQSYKQRFTQGSTPLLVLAGVTLGSFFMTRYRRSANGLLPVVRIAAGLLPFFMAGSRAETTQTTKQTDNLIKNKMY